MNAVADFEIARRSINFNDCPTLKSSTHDCFAAEICSIMIPIRASLQKARPNYVATSNLRKFLNKFTNHKQFKIFTKFILMPSYIMYYVENNHNSKKTGINFWAARETTFA